MLGRAPDRRRVEVGRIVLGEDLSFGHLGVVTRLSGSWSRRRGQRSGRREWRVPVHRRGERISRDILVIFRHATTCWTERRQKDSTGRWKWTRAVDFGDGSRVASAGLCFVLLSTGFLCPLLYARPTVCFPTLETGHVHIPGVRDPQPLTFSSPRAACVNLLRPLPPGTRPICSDGEVSALLAAGRLESRPA